MRTTPQQQIEEKPFRRFDRAVKRRREDWKE